MTKNLIFTINIIYYIMYKNKYINYRYEYINIYKYLNLKNRLT